MLNIIKMDLYRMLKTKSMYVIWIVLAAILLITTSLEVIFMARRKDSPQKAAMREMMRDYLKNNDISSS